MENGAWKKMKTGHVRRRETALEKARRGRLKKWPLACRRRVEKSSSRHAQRGPEKQLPRPDTISFRGPRLLGKETRRRGQSSRSFLIIKVAQENLKGKQREKGLSCCQKDVNKLSESHMLPSRQRRSSQNHTPKSGAHYCN